MNAGTCKHFNSLYGQRDGENHRCRKGICYTETFDDSRPGIVLRMPCIQFRVLPRSIDAGRR